MGKKDDHSNDEFEDIMSAAEEKGELGEGKQKKLIPKEEYDAAKKGVAAAVEPAPDPKDHDFSKYILNSGRILIFVPEIPKILNSGLSVGEVTRAKMAEDAKDSTSYRVYGVSEDVKTKVEVGDNVMVSAGSWQVIKLDGFNMKVLEDYHIALVIKDGK